MGAVQIPDHIKSIIDRQIAEGRVASEAAYLEEAVRRYAEDLEAEDELRAMAHAGIADAEAGRYTEISSGADSEALHQRTMDRLRGRLADDPHR